MISALPRIRIKLQIQYLDEFSKPTESRLAPKIPNRASSARSYSVSHFLDRLLFFRKKQSTFAGNHGEVSNEDRSWENGYRQRWQHDKIVRSTHGVNCTGSCSWKIYVKNGLVT